MNESPPKEIIDVKCKLKRKYEILNNAKALNATDEQIVAIRRKIYEDQDEMIYLCVKNNFNPPKSWYKGI